MKRNYLIALLFIFIGLSSFSQERVRVATYNIKYLNTEIPDDRKTHIENVLTELDADIIGLQEIDDRAALELIFPKDEWHLIIDDDSGSNQDVALAVRKTLKVEGFSGNKLDADDEHFLFRSAPNKFFPKTRDLLCVEVVLQNDVSLWIMVAHTKARVGGRHETSWRREGASKMIVDKFETDFDGKNYVLLGDMNDSPDDISMNILETGNDNAVASMENEEGTFMINLTETLWTDDNVTFGRNTRDRLPNAPSRITTRDPGARQRNFDHRSDDTNVGDCLFDQLLIPAYMKNSYISGSVHIFDDASAVVTNSRNRASDHLPVYADFDFSTDPDEIANVSIVSALPNPSGSDYDNEEIGIKNNTNTSVSLNGWYFMDRSDNKHEVSGELAAEGELSIKLSGNKMPLNNSGDTIYLYDSTDQLISSVSYTVSQVKEGVSINF